jgi:hypothetical protein
MLSCLYDEACMIELGTGVEGMITIRDQDLDLISVGMDVWRVGGRVFGYVDSIRLLSGVGVR